MGENGLYSSKCNFVSPLFGIEKTGKRFSRLKRRRESELHLRLAKFRLFWAKTDYILQSATLYLRFSESKRRAKDFRGSNAAAKAWLREDFTLKSVNAYHNYFSPPKPQKCSFCTVHKAVSQNRRATGARMGLVSKHGLVDIMPDFYAMSRCGMRKLYLGCASVDFYCYYTVNRTYFSAQLAFGKMTLLNYSFVFRRCGVKIRFCFAGTK